MKLISSVVRPDRLEAVKQALGTINVVALTVVEARDFAPQRHATTAWMGHLYTHESSTKMEVRSRRPRR